jgi:hypothetical protein
MRTVLTLLCTVALVFAVNGAQDEKKKEQQKKKAPPAGQMSHVGGPAKPGHPSGSPVKHAETGKATGVEKRMRSQHHQDENVTVLKGAKASTQVGQATGTGRTTKAAKVTGANKAGGVQQAKLKPIQPRHFNVPAKPNIAKAPPVKFEQNRRIEGSQNWQGEKYVVFRNYKSEWHDRNWWHSHHSRIVFVFGAPYYWSAGYWYPAWGYYPNAYYAWDGPIYAYNNLPPDQVIANVQAALQEQGYYHGEVDGLLGPLTRAALADYQRDHGLYVTSAIDQPTLESLGMS